MSIAAELPTCHSAHILLNFTKFKFSGVDQDTASKIPPFTLKYLGCSMSLSTVTTINNKKKEVKKLQHIFFETKMNKDIFQGLPYDII